MDCNAVLDIVEVTAGDVTVVDLRGRLDADAAPALQAKLGELIDGGRSRFVLDLAALDYVNSLGLRVLLMAAKRLSPLGGRIVLCGLQPWIRQSFESVGFDRLFGICGTREEAVLACARPLA